ncbi:hypothetical protein MVEN_00380100 [Mycena venus]|uniref:Uncharacterized protein n=1 Tax=Mycena venus TaxID=2733690 RepID=A0A8H6YPW8_9AGAR|nr:hypothetical protein MVEN_00380100 [Mycena venus]
MPKAQTQGTCERTGHFEYFGMKRNEATVRAGLVKPASSSRSRSSLNTSSELEGRLSVAGDDGTTRVGLGGATVRKDIERGLLYELEGKRFQSSDLVEHVLGAIVTIDQAAVVLSEFLRCNLLSVKAKDPNKPDPTTEDACLFAAHCARSAADVTVLPQAERYLWQWHPALRSGTKMQTIDFMGVVAEAAYVLALSSEVMDSSSTPRSVFCTSPRPHHATPLPDAESGQDSRPDGFLLPVASLVIKDGARQQYIMPPPAQELLKTLRPSYWPEARGMSLDTLSTSTDLSRFFTDVEVDTEPKTLRQRLKHLNTDHEERCAKLMKDPQFIIWSSRVQAINGFDTSWMCWPSIRASGECKITDLAAAKAQVAIYMRLQRCTQPWQRSALGFIANKSFFGLSRTDPSGIEECHFDRSTSLGVIEVIRLCLGLSLADDQTLGLEAGFELGLTSCPSSESVSDPKVTPKKRGLDRGLDQLEVAESPTKKPRPQTPSSRPQTPSSRPQTPSSTKWPPLPDLFIFPKVDRIVLDDATFLVHGLVYNSGSLVGRCTRVFSVSRQLLDQEKCDFIHRHGDLIAADQQNKVFWDGRFALKLIYNDIKSEAFADKLQLAATEAGVKELLLPDKTWSRG